MTQVIISQIDPFNGGSEDIIPLSEIHNFDKIPLSSQGFCNRYFITLYGLTRELALRMGIPGIADLVSRGSQFPVIEMKNLRQFECEMPLDNI